MHEGTEILTITQSNVNRIQISNAKKQQKKNTNKNGDPAYSIYLFLSTQSSFSYNLAPAYSVPESVSSPHCFYQRK